MNRKFKQWWSHQFHQYKQNNNHLSSQIIEHENRQRYMTLEIQVLAWDRHTLGPVFPFIYVLVFCVQWFEVRDSCPVGRFVNIGEIDAHHCLNFLFLRTSYSWWDDDGVDTNLQINMPHHHDFDPANLC